MTGGNSLHVMGSKFGSEGQMDVNATNAFQHLKQELFNCQSENKKLAEQLNCLVSLIKRSWNGDNHATFHLSNIVGMEPPPLPGRVENGAIARPNSQVQFKSRSESNWERLAMRLLEREYETVQQEIMEYQQKYIENRQAYMDAVLQDHYQSMARIPLHRVTDPSMEEVDAKFIRYNKSLQRMGVTRPRVHRAQSAGPVRRKTSLPEAVEQMEVSLRELVSDTPSGGHFSVSQELSTSYAPNSKSMRRPQSSYHPRQPPNTYNDPSRYVQGSLYELNHNDPVKKPRPVSATSLVQGDIIRSRPRSGYNAQSDRPPVFVTQKFERPLKYETTRPVKSKTTKQKRPQTAGSIKKVTINPKVETASENDMMNISNRHSSMHDLRGQVEPSEDMLSHPHNTERYHDENSPNTRGEDITEEAENVSHNRPPMAVRVKSASSVRRPAFIDEFSNDELAMREMEKDFKKTAVSLQKKLGIGEIGIVSYD